MNRPYICAALIASACTIGSSKLTLSVGSEPLVADGTTPRSITVCNESTDPASSVTATLHATSGTWLAAKSTDPTSADLTLSSAAPCASGSWIPPTRKGPVDFWVEVGGTIIARQEASTVAATIKQLELGAGLLSATDVSSVPLMVDFATDTGGQATEGTQVTLKVLSSDPAGQGYLSSGSLIVGKRDSVTLSTSAGTKSVRVQARLTTDSSVLDCKEISQTNVVACK